MHDSDGIIIWLLDAGRLSVNTDTGQVFSSRSNTPEKPLGALTRKGYLRTLINVDGQPHSILIHRVVCIAAHGPAPVGKAFVNHKNAFKTDNRAQNLEWVSHVENMSHASAMGTHRFVGRRDNNRDQKGRFGRKVTPCTSTN